MIVSANLRRLSAIPVVMAGLLFGLLPASSAAADAESSSIQASQPEPWNGEFEEVYTVRALTAAEINARGLDKYVDVSEQTATAMPLEDWTTRSSPFEPIQRGSDSSSPQAAGCWNGSFGAGDFTGPAYTWGKTDVHWCGNGSFVTYASSNCYGYNNVPTRAYLGCNNYPNYGVGWNLYQVKTQWNICFVWVPGWGSCLAEEYPWVEGQFLGDGRAIQIGSGG